MGHCPLKRLTEAGSSSNVMIADDGVTPILMDFGSAARARIHIENRSQALLQQVILFQDILFQLLRLESGHRGRTKYDGVPCSRTFRC